MNQLLGEYTCKIDTKSRVRLPSGLISQFEGSGPFTFVINRGLEKCLVLYPEKVWEEETKEINKLNTYDKKNRDFVRYFFRGATKVTMDSADRILLPKALIGWANMEKETVLSAIRDRIEIWPKEKWESLLEEEPVDFSQLAQEVLGNKTSETE